MNKSLGVVLALQMLVMTVAVGFLASRSVAHPAPRARTAERPPVAHPSDAHPTDEHPATKLADEDTDWNHFPDGGAPGPAAAAGHATTPAKPAAVAPASFEALVGELVAGNGRFIDGVARQYDAAGRRASTASEERASAVVVTCTDSRVVPELLFDQPLGTFSVLRLPGAQLDEAGVRAVEDAVQRLHASAVLVLGHLGCHHVQRVLEQRGAARPGTLKGAFAGLAGQHGEALDAAATRASVSFAARELRRRSKPLAGSAEVTLLRVVYAPLSGKLEWLDAEAEPEPALAHRAGRR